MIDADGLISRMERFGRMLPMVVAGISPADARWKPMDGAWSVLEIVRHLGDEEVEDFRLRLQWTLDEPQRDWGMNDPEGRAVERRYNEGVLEQAVERFVAERAASIAWLRGRSNSDWKSAHSHSQFGTFHAGDLLGAWAAHDALHLRQIAKRLFQLCERDAGGFSIAYAGEWRA